MAKPQPLPPIITDAVFSVVQKFRFIGQICQTSYYYRRPVGGTTNVNLQIAELAALWTGVPQGAIQGAVSVGTELFEHRVYCITRPDIATLVTTTAGLMGLRAGDPLPPQVALVFTKYTNYRGRHARGRMFIGGMSETDSTNGEPTAAYTAIAQGFATNLVAAMGPGVNGGTFFPVVAALSTLINAGTPEAPIWTIRGADVTSCVARLIWNTQRRRTFGRGS